MQTKPKVNSIITHTVDEAGVLTFHVKGCEPIIFDPAKVSEVNRARFMIHGILQRVNDAAALSRNTADGKAAPPEAKRAAMARVAEHYLSGALEWALPRAEAAPGLDNVLLAAVMEATGKDEDAVRKMIADGAAKRGMKPGAYLTQLGTAKAVAPILARMRAEATTIDADDELAAMTQDDDAEDEPTE